MNEGNGAASRDGQRGEDLSGSPPPFAGGGWGEAVLEAWRRRPLSPTPSHKGRARFLALILLGLPVAALAQAQPASGWKQMTSKQLATACHASDPAQRWQLVNSIRRARES